MPPVAPGVGHGGLNVVERELGAIVQDVGRGFARGQPAQHIAHGVFRIAYAQFAVLPVVLHVA